MTTDPLETFPAPVSSTTVASILNQSPLLLKFEELKSKFPTQSERDSLEALRKELIDAAQQNKKIEDLWAVVSNAKSIVLKILAGVSG